MSQHLFKTIRRKLQTYLEYSWYNRNFLSYALWPIGQLYRLISQLRKLYFQRYKQQNFSVPVIIVGNITVGGVGKTPLVIAIANKLLANGFKVGIVSRGYGASNSQFPYQVNVNDKACKAGDEPLLIAMHCACPVVIDPKRPRAVEYLLNKYQLDVVLSDDGLQHYALGRSIEIAVVNGDKPYGNGFYQPAGPLREGACRLNAVDFIVSNGVVKNKIFPKNKTFTMHIKAGDLRNCLTQNLVNYKDIKMPCKAVAAIGSPDRFFNTLQEIGIQASQVIYPDHYQYQRADFTAYSAEQIVMTAKDYVKCKDFATANMFYLEVVAEVADSFWERLFLAIRGQ